MLQTLRYGFNYATEAVSNAKGLADSLKYISSDKDVSDYLSTNRIYPSSAMGLLGLMFYDMAVLDNGIKKERELIGRTASRIILLTDIVDDIIDERPTSLDDKFAFLDRVQSDMFGYSSNKSKDLQEESSYVLARSIYSDFLSSDKDGKVEEIFGELVGIIKKQFTESRPNELFRIAKTIGSCCTDTTAVLTEIVTGKEYGHIREAARKIGEYCEILDNWYELDEDILEGVNTYPTVRIREEGDSSELRKEIKEEMLSVADDSIKRGFKCLSTKEQKSIYKVLKTMVDIKYKVVDRF